MNKERYTARNLPPEFSDTSRWRRIDIEALSEELQRRFRLLELAIQTYLQSGSLKAAYALTGVSKSCILDQLNRCVTIAADGQLWGWAGLLRSVPVKAYERRICLPRGAPGAARGFAGAFSKFLENNQAIRDELDAMILKKKERRDKIYEAGISIKSVAETFRELCVAQGIHEDEYPLNSKSCGRKSIERYVKNLVEQEVAAGTRSRYGEEAARRLSIGTGFSRAPLNLAPYDAGGLDAHKIDCIGCIIIQGPAGPQSVAISRLWLVAHVEEVTKAILGYTIAIRQEPSSATIEQTLICTGEQWCPRTLSIPGLRYAEGSGLPSGVIPELVGCYPAVIKLDNAAPHFAVRIAENARRRTGCTLAWGGIGRWEHNKVVERLFRTLESYGFHRLPSTTGSNPTDPLRANAIEEAIERAITWEALLDLTDVIVAEYNATKSRGLGGRSPLEVLRDHFHALEPSFLPRRLPPPTVSQPELGIVVETRTVRGNQSQGRRPYIELDRCHYTSPLLARSFGLVGNQIRLHVRESDMRTVVAFFMSGEELGTLRAQGDWGKTAHTREMRKQINALCDAGELAWGPGEDPVRKLLQYLADKAYRDAQRRPRKISRPATQLAEAAHSSGLGVPVASAADPGTTMSVEPLTRPRPMPMTLRKPTWKSVT